MFGFDGTHGSPAGIPGRDELGAFNQLARPFVSRLHLHSLGLVHKPENLAVDVFATGYAAVDMYLPPSPLYFVYVNRLFRPAPPPNPPPRNSVQGVVLKAIFPKSGDGAQVRLVAGLWNSGVTSSSGDGGKATSAVMAYPKGVAIDADDAVYVAEFQGERIRKVSTSGIISTVAGTGRTVRSIRWILASYYLG